MKIGDLVTVRLVFCKEDMEFVHLKTCVLLVLAVDVSSLHTKHELVFIKSTKDACNSFFFLTK
jgi:hypothetical protein